MNRVLRIMWEVSRYCWHHRKARKITVELLAEYHLAPADAIACEWRFLQESKDTRREI